MPENITERRYKFYDSLQLRQVEWLFYPYIPYGKLTVIQGDPGDGKTTLALSLAAMLSTGQPMPGDDVPREPQTVIYQTGEDGHEDTIFPRLTAAGADCSKIAFITEDMDFDSASLETTIADIGARMVVIDPITAFVTKEHDMNRAGDMRKVMRNLAGIAERHNCAMLLIGHMNKSSGAKGLYRGYGSIDITAAARSVLLVGALRDTPDVRVMAHIKSSLAKKGESLAFEIDENSAVRFRGTIDITGEELLAGKTDEVAVPEDTKRETAADIIAGMLRGKCRHCNEIYEACEAAGIKESTVNRAKKELGVKSVRKEGRWYWSLPSGKY